MLSITKGFCNISINYVQTDQGILPAIISQWHEENILEHITSNDRADKLRVVSLFFHCSHHQPYFPMTGIRLGGHIVVVTSNQSQTWQSPSGELDLFLLAQSIYYVSSQGNVMVSSDRQILLADVGLNLISRRFALGSGGLPLPPAWAYKPPEELNLGDEVMLIEHTYAMDVYSFAATVYAVCTGQAIAGY
jgi:hypothetical protein